MSAGIGLGAIDQSMSDRTFWRELTVGRGEDSSRSFSLGKREEVFSGFPSLRLSQIQVNTLSFFDPSTQGFTSPKTARGGSLGRPVGLVLGQTLSEFGKAWGNV